MKRMAYQFSIVVAVLILGFSPRVSAGEEKYLRVSLIKAERAEKYEVDEKIESLAPALKAAFSKGDAKDFKRFIPIKIKECEKIQLGNKYTVPLTKTMFLDLTLDAFEKDHYPITVRWYIREKVIDEKGEESFKDKEIIKAKKHNLPVDYSLFIGKKPTDKMKTAQLIAIEIIEPPLEKSAPEKPEE